MDYDKISDLLDKYYNGETLLEEEKILRSFFNNKDIPSEILDEKILFNSFNKLKKESLPNPELKNELLNLVDLRWKEFTKEKFQKIKKWPIGAAASIVIGLSVYLYHNQKPIPMEDTFTNEQQAYAATKQVLMYISETMNSESAKLESLAQINESFGNMDKLKKIDKAIKNYKSKEK